MLEAHLGLAVYLPQVDQRRRGRMAPAPLFPGYLFVESAAEKFVRSAVDAQPGVIRVVTIDAQPCEVDANVVAALRSQVAAVNAAGGLPQHPFKPGDRVRLQTGPLEGMEAIFLGPTMPSERAEILLSFLGRAQRARVDIAELEPIAAPRTALHPPRRTRGHGRRIQSYTDAHG
jgi:transcription antitermination factor NusG